MNSPTLNFLFVQRDNIGIGAGININFFLIIICILRKIRYDAACFGFMVECAKAAARLAAT